MFTRQHYNCLCSALCYGLRGIECGLGWNILRRMGPGWNIFKARDPCGCILQIPDPRWELLQRMDSRWSILPGLDPWRNTLQRMDPRWNILPSLNSRWKHPSKPWTDAACLDRGVCISGRIDCSSLVSVVLCPRFETGRGGRNSSKLLTNPSFQASTFSRYRSYNSFLDRCNVVK